MRQLQFKLWSLLKETAREWNTDNCLRLGASLSYYALFSLFPLILVVLAIVQVLLTNSEGARDAILRGLASVTGGFREDFVRALDAAIETRATVGVVGTVMLLFGASWVFGELTSAFNIIWDVEEPSRGGPFEFLRAPLFSFALVLVVAFLLLASLVISAAMTTISTFTPAFPGAGLVGNFLQFTINLGILTLLFALLFRVVPRTEVAWSDVWLGAGLTAGSWTFLQSAIAYYIALSSYAIYGSIGAILALVAWVFLSSQVLFFGGEFTAVYARRYGSRVAPAVGPPAIGVVREALPVRELANSPSMPQHPTATSHSQRRARLTTGGLGITVGMIGTVLALAIAGIMGLMRALRLLRGR